MKKYKNFDEMFNDNDYVSEEDREIINLEVKLIGKMIAVGSLRCNIIGDTV